MYYRIKNWLDARAVAVWIHRENMDNTVGDRIQELAEQLDEAYGATRPAFSNGGYIIFFPTREVYNELIDPLVELYNIIPEQREYLDFIGKEKTWCEELYMFTEEALVFMYPKE